MQFAEALAKLGEKFDAMAVDAMQRFAVRASSKVVGNSPVASVKYPHRGIFRGNWRLRLTGSDRVVLTIPDPSGTTTVAAMERVVRAGPTELEGWSDIRISNPYPGAERIEREASVVGRAVSDLLNEVRA